MVKSLKCCAKANTKWRNCWPNWIARFQLGGTHSHRFRDFSMAKILLVEDNEMNRDMLSRRLERKGYQVVMAVDGAEAVTMAEGERPDLILMDMSLPVMDGWEATRRVKAAE